MNGEQKKFVLQVFVGLAIIVSFIYAAVQHTLSTAEIAFYSGFFAGVFIKVLLPFIRKIQEGKIDGFSAKYFWTIIVTFLYSIPLAWGLIQSIESFNILPWPQSLILGLFIGIGTNWTTEEVLRYFLYLKKLYKKLGAKDVVAIKYTPSSEGLKSDDILDTEEATKMVLSYDYPGAKEEEGEEEEEG